MKKKRIDLFIGDSSLVWFLAGTHATEGLAALPVALSREHLAWGIRKGNQQFLAEVNAFVQQATADGTFDKAFHLWMAVPH